MSEMKKRILELYDGQAIKQELVDQMMRLWLSRMKFIMLRLHLQLPQVMIQRLGRLLLLEAGGPQLEGAPSL